MTRHAHELDCVELLIAVDDWPAGTTGTVVSEDPDTALVEVAAEHHGTDSDGSLVDPLDLFVDVPYSALKVTTPYVPRSG